MEMQRSFSMKPIKFLAFSFTISFSVVFLIFFSIWVFHGTHLSHQQTRNLRFQKLSRNFSGNVLKNPVWIEDSPQVTNVTSSRMSKSKISVVTGAEREENLLSVDSFFDLGDGLNSNSTDEESEELNDVIDTVGLNSNSTDEESRELNDVIDTVDDEIDTSEKEDIISDVPFEIKNNSIKNSIEEKNKVDCDITKGRWIFDESYPLYSNVTCPFIDEGFNCEANGRLNKDYMKWRWQPQDCDIPRFNATEMLELIRGKRLVFVGDSINRNQWESMLCLLMRGVKDTNKVYETRRRRITKEKGNYSFMFEEYKCTVEYYVTHFLVHEGKARIGKKRVQTLRIDSIDKGSSRWRGADILVFNTAHWWSHHKTKAGINYYQEGNQVHPQLDVTKAFKKALSTWASWVDKSINPRKTRIFFRSSSPSHFSGGLWNTGGHCKEAFRPINETYITSNYPEKNLIVEDIISRMKTPVTFLNITRLSDYRPDAHPSIYGRKTSNGVQDCSHWCLPGVPDNWNVLLYYYLLQSKTKNNFVN